MAHFTPSRTALWTSFGLSVLVVLFLLVDAGVSIFAPHLLADVQAQVGFPAELSPLLGGIMLLCALVFAIPRTAAIGAILITAFAGGAICTHVRIGELGSPPQLIAFALAAIAWLSLWLRDADVRRALGYRS
ncbi:DoxX family protein [Hyphomicrobium sp.]|uniref:DoxX family protein n=1 Tax=Hyphomicrobium sp. TaxID=82 RepID=UPI0025BBC569|nr:DoxX family protein [Hyphomicrobium sp.]MCC7254116.1 DoxX family protein [Hyphomicrobium sp.]